jgi:glycosyltransferase involved in cell wall biosynthesis
MKILYALNSAQRGGMENHTLDLAEGMHNRGHEVHVWCPEGPLVEEFDKIGISVVLMEIKPSLIGLDVDLPYIIAQKKFLKDKKIDVLHCHGLRAVGSSLIAGFLAKTPIRISHIHTPFSEWRVPGWKRWLYSFSYSLATTLFSTREIALTPSRKEVKIREGIKERKLEVIPNGLRVEDFTFTNSQKASYRDEILTRHALPAETFVFGVIGRLSAEKGTDVLIDAYAKFLEYGVDDATHLLIIGGGPLLDELNEKIKRLSLEDRITITGRYSEEDKFKYLAALDTFTFPSLAEGFGIVLIEAMAAGLPIIASDLEVLQEVGGSMVWFFETGNSDDLAEKMYNMFSKRDRLINLSEGAKKRVSDLYTLERFVASYEKLYLDLLEGTK